jgi:hypothetical protein
MRGNIARLLHRVESERRALYSRTGRAPRGPINGQMGHTMPVTPSAVAQAEQDERVGVS